MDGNGSFGNIAKWKIDGIDKPVDLNVYVDSPKQWRAF
jgi:GH25 family lysozyme M1 (1,4-beta-N-acetylmuramidase)